jgi:hypothetical protein
MMVKKMMTDASAYSMSEVADKAMSINETKRKDWLSNIDFSLEGIVIALPEKRPWYKMINEKMMGVLRTFSSGLDTGDNAFDNFAIY